ncbi:hypothetical protein SAMN05216266_112207 [Amycolatopsis marina]|uniref:Cell division protein FtsL n=1 Tax=Amycolatopsis marina TaxID=490629 RepID=A0A1I1B8A7_9PSEU|nr:hypothetical protein [Amycolatopsis marina]SFB46589.1 hypothetical protein SAMN05216266_112207 [Amycolatopsis marina]
MTAPTRSRARSTTARAARQRARSATTTTETPRPSRARQQPAQRTSAAERAYARRAQRAELSQGARRGGELARRRKWLPRLRGPQSRASFVVVMMGLLAAGVAATLWLSTQAIADTYRLDELNETNARLLERKEQLQQQVTRQESPSALAERAKALGMVPATDPAHIVVEPDGSIRVVGEPKKAEGTAPPAQPDPAADESPAATDPEGGAGDSDADRVAGAAGPQGESGDGAP